MKDITRNTNCLVIVGAWNIAIFTKEWVEKFLLENGKSMKVYYPTILGRSLRFEFDDIAFYIEGNRLMFQIINSSNEESSYTKVVCTARQIVQKLGQTPVSALGTNFLLKLESNESAADCFSECSFIQRINKDMSAFEEGRYFKFKYSEKEILNALFKKKEGPNSAIIAEFNFNYNVSDSEELLQILGNESLMKTNRSKIFNILGDENE
jgi:hypothetical protein